MDSTTDARARLAARARTERDSTRREHDPPSPGQRDRGFFLTPLKAERCREPMLSKIDPLGEASMRIASLW